MRRLSDILSCISIVFWVVKLALDGYIPPDLAGPAMLGLVVLLGLSRVLNFGIGRLVLRVGLPVATMATFLIKYGHGEQEQMSLIFMYMMVLLIIVFGIYIMIAGPYVNNRQR